MAHADAGCCLKSIMSKKENVSSRESGSVNINLWRRKSVRREQCWAVRSRSREISNTKVFEEPEDDILVSKFGSVYDCAFVCVRVCVCVLVQSGENLVSPEC